MEHLKYRGKVLRVLINAQDEKSVKSALANLRDNAEFKSMHDSALARSRADWLVGMNLSRAYTILGRNAGHSQVFSVGRVQTPTLGLVVRREREIKNFRSIDFGEIKGDFSPLSEGHAFCAKWKAKEDQEGLDPDGRLIDKAVMEKLLGRMRGMSQAIVVSCETTPMKESQPLPFSLSALQVVAGKKFGYSPQMILDICQKLYESKLTSYPRSDCDYLPTSQLADASTILDNLGQFDDLISGWVAGVDVSIRSRAWNDKEITAHHAIIPTTVCAKAKDLPDSEKNVYVLIAQAYVAQFYPVHEYNQTAVKVDLAGEEFGTSGRVVTREGFKVIYGKDSEKEDAGEKEEEDCKLPLMKKGDSLTVNEVLPVWKKTQPPKRFTKATILQAMKDIHKFVKDEDKKKRLKSTKGIGTEATRSKIIEDLSKRGFMRVVKKYLEPTEAGCVLIDALPEIITLPDETAEWEDGLEEILRKENGTTLDRFVNGLAGRLPELMGIDQAKGNFAAQWPCCPECGKGAFVRLPSKFQKGEFWWGCSNPECKAKRDDENGTPVERKEKVLSKDFPCPECGTGFLTKRKGRAGKGDWWGCTNWPECKVTRPDNHGKPGNGDVVNKDYPCSCGKGYLVKHKGKPGKKDWWGCSDWKNGCKETRVDDHGKPKGSK